ncbi:MAG: tetratricopeptide repeat protein [Myxococcota bacterium]
MVLLMCVSFDRKATIRWSWVALALTLLYALAVMVRAHRLEQLEVGDGTPFWIESAMRYRIITQVYSGEGPPMRDMLQQHPEGYFTYGDTILQEYVYGTLARLFQPESLTAFVRLITPALYSLLLFPMFWLCYQATGSAGAALVACVLYTTLPPSIDRSNGLVIYRENVCFPLLALHLAALFAASRAVRGYGLMVLSAAALVGMHLAWKVSTFYQVMLLVYFLFIFIFYDQSLKLKLIILLHSVPLFLLSFLPPLPLLGTLSADRYWGSLNGALTLVLCVLCAVVHPPPLQGGHPRSHFSRLMDSPWVRLALSVGLLLLFVKLLPGGQSYGHAWSTLRAHLEFPFGKPKDPSELNIAARHYWTGNYRSPNLARGLRDFAFPAPLLVFLLRRKVTLSRFLPSQFKLADLGWGLSLLSFVAYVVAYLLIRKFGTLLALFSMPLVALACVTMLEQAQHRKKLAVGVLVGLLSVAYLSAWNDVGADKLVTRITESEDKSPREELVPEEPSVVYSIKSFNEVSQWIRDHTTEKEPILASWVLAPYLSAYLERTTVIHSFFESDNIFRVEAYYEVLFQPLEKLHTFARQYGSRYLVLEAHFLLRTDEWMSYRYVANRLQLTGDEACYRLHYQPENSPGFALRYQNEYFRVYEVLPEAVNAPVLADLAYAPLFDAEIPGAQVGAPLDQGPKLLYGMLEAQRYWQVGQLALRKQLPDQALAAWVEGLKYSSWHPDLWKGLYALARAQGRTQEAERIAAEVQARFHTHVTLDP